MRRHIFIIIDSHLLDIVYIIYVFIIIFLMPNETNMETIYVSYVKHL